LPHLYRLLLLKPFVHNSVFCVHMYVVRGSKWVQKVSAIGNLAHFGNTSLVVEQISSVDQFSALDVLFVIGHPNYHHHLLGSQ
jgi:hypothetical protein